MYVFIVYLPHQPESTSVKCKTCRASFAHKEYLLAHRCRASKEKGIICRKCGKRLSASAMALHKKSHSKDRPYKCENCEKRYKLRAHLQRHVQLCYNKPMKYKCRYCEARFRTFSPELVRHERTEHLNIKPAQCPICKHNWTDTRNMRRHLRMHTQEKPHKCSICNKAFTRRDNRDTHEANIHGQRRTSGLASNKKNNRTQCDDDEEMPELEEPRIYERDESFV